MTVKDGCLTSREGGMEACIQHSREIFLEGRLMHITMEVLVAICTVIAVFFKMIEAVVKTVFTIVDCVRDYKRKK